MGGKGSLLPPHGALSGTVSTGESPARGRRTPAVSRCVHWLHLQTWPGNEVPAGSPSAEGCE